MAKMKKTDELGIFSIKIIEENSETLLLFF